MVCETCEQLQTADGDEKLPPFFCKQAGRIVRTPRSIQRWCPKENNRKERDRLQYFVQTTEKEMRFVDSLTQLQLRGYIKGTKARTPAKTDFDIPIIITYAQERLKKIQNVAKKTV